LIPEKAHPSPPHPLLSIQFSLPYFRSFLYNRVMKNIESIKKVSLIFFIIVGAIHIISTALIINNISLKTAEIINNTLFVPFLVSSLIYGSSSLRLSLFPEHENHKFLDTTLSAIIVIITITSVTLSIIY